MEYLFEKYINNGNERIFIGYKRVIADNLQEAKDKALEKEDSAVMIFPIADPANF